MFGESWPWYAHVVLTLRHCLNSTGLIEQNAFAGITADIDA
jgi:hypothetical protein